MRRIILSIAITLIAFSGCKKTFLDAKPDNSLVVPSSLPDLQALLDDDRIMNGSTNENIGGPNPTLLVEGSDDYYVTEDLYDNCSLYSKNVYIWAKDNVYGGNTSILDWSSPYRAIYYANDALDGLVKIAKNNQNGPEWDNIRGSALFYRAHCFYQLAQAFAMPYNQATAAKDLGIPIRLSADISEKSIRSSVEQTYQQIISDLKTALPFLPQKPLYKTRPSRPAVYGLLARVYQTMGDYDNSLNYSDSCLNIFSSLIDYNNLDSTISYPIPLFSEEVIYATIVQDIPTELFYSSQANIDSNIYNLYGTNDLRRTIFFSKDESTGLINFRGSYDNSGYPFCGIASDEIYLIKAECLARTGNINGALQILNSLLKTRWRQGTFNPIQSNSPAIILSDILTERRKELLMRGFRWTDLRRLNTDHQFAVTLKRVINGQTYSLPPGDNRYTWPIPQDVISLNPGMIQNPR